MKTFLESAQDAFRTGYVVQDKSICDHQQFSLMCLIKGSSEYFCDLSREETTMLLLLMAAIQGEI